MPTTSRGTLPHSGLLQGRRQAGLKLHHADDDDCRYAGHQLRLRCCESPDECERSSIHLGRQPHSAALRGLRGNLLSDGNVVYAYPANSARDLRRSSQSLDKRHRRDDDNPICLQWRSHSASLRGLRGARLQQIVNNLPTTYTLDLAAPLVQVLIQQDANGETAYLYGVTRVGEQQPDGWAYHLSDARPCPTLHRSVGGPLGVGSVRQLADVDGQVTLARGYTPYGEPLWSEGAGQSAYGFTGEDFDVSTGLVFLQARYMSPRLGIFLSHDPWSGDVLRPRSMNGWIYVEGNPVNFTDRTGEIGPCLPPNSLVRDPETGQLKCVSPWGGVIGGVGVGTLPGTGGAASELLKWLARIGVGICTGVLAETLRLHGPHVIVELGAGDYSNAIAMKEQFPYAVVIATNLVSEWDFGRMLVKYHHTPDPFTTQFPMDMYFDNVRFVEIG